MDVRLLKLRLRSLVIMLAIVLYMFTFRNGILPKAAKATYVEGVITEDTIWTMVDSPFIVSNDLTVSPGATLTIEPGVEVRFGGFFSLTILGKLFANGTLEVIRFASNKQQPESGDWKAVEIKGLERSTLIGCSVTHATDGIFIENSDAEVKNTNISFCSGNGATVVNGKIRIQESIISHSSQNGIDAVNSELTIQDNLIIDNDDNGIEITGDRLTIVRRNNIISNRNGILLTGNESSNIQITQNVVSASDQSGIRLDSNIHTNLNIMNNNISSNYRGFYISSLADTYIANNSIAYNDIGVLYGQGSHTANFNDFYGNDLGMNVEANATVDAEHNYWGHETGPHHEILNPKGKGDPVGGDGVNLDFLFFLTKPFGQVNTRPNATLLTDKVLTSPGETVMFFGTNSHDDGRVDRYFFDFGDGNTSDWTTLSTVTHQYLSTGVFSTSLTVMDDFGALSVNSATVTMEAANLPSLHTNIDLSNHAIYEGEQIAVTVHVTDDTMEIEDAQVTLFSLKGGDFTDSSGFTNSTGYFATTFTAPDVTHATNIRIVATAAKTGYADGSDYDDLESLPSLSVQVVSNRYVRTEKTTEVIVLVKSNEQTVDGATVSLIADHGDFSITSGITDSDGIFSTHFTAPQTTEYLNVTMTATVMKIDYLSGVGQVVVTVEPKVLAVHVTAEPTVTISEASVDVSVHVEYDTIPVSSANVTVTAEGFNASGLTDLGGDLEFSFTAPQVNDPDNITLLLKARKDGYVEGGTQLQITVKPGELDVWFELSNSTVRSGESTVVAVYVACNGTPIEGASVVVSPTYGGFSVPTRVTNTEGYCLFSYNAPRVTVQFADTVAANVTKNGYSDGGNQTTVTVTPEAATQPSGWPLTTILLILIPVVIAIVIVVLVKLGIISFSDKEEES